MGSSQDVELRRTRWAVPPPALLRMRTRLAPPAYAQIDASVGRRVLTSRVGPSAQANPCFAWEGAGVVSQESCRFGTLGVRCVRTLPRCCGTVEQQNPSLHFHADLPRYRRDPACALRRRFIICVPPRRSCRYVAFCADHNKRASQTQRCSFAFPFDPPYHRCRPAAACFGCCLGCLFLRCRAVRVLQMPHEPSVLVALGTGTAGTACALRPRDST